MKKFVIGILAACLNGCGGGAGERVDSLPSLSSSGGTESKAFRVSLDKVVAKRNVDGAVLEVDVSGITSDVLSLKE